MGGLTIGALPPGGPGRATPTVGARRPVVRRGYPDRGEAFPRAATDDDVERDIPEEPGEIDPAQVPMEAQ